MVKRFSPNDAQLLHDSIEKAKHATSAELSVVIAKASHTYAEFFLLYGLLLGSALALGLWRYGISDVPLLMAAQLAVTGSFFLPWTQFLVPFLIPLRVRHAHAARQAREEFHRHEAHAPDDAKLVVWYIAQAERYTHIYASRSVRRVIADNAWEEIIARFTRSMAQKGLHLSCEETIASISAALANHFPAATHEDK